VARPLKPRKPASEIYAEMKAYRDRLSAAIEAFENTTGNIGIEPREKVRRKSRTSNGSTKPNTEG
jgi:hypothetical protein